MEISSYKVNKDSSLLFYDYDSLRRKNITEISYYNNSKSNIIKH